MSLFIPDMAGHLFLVILLFDTFQYIEAQGPYLPPPSLTVRPAVIRERDSVHLSCETPPSLHVSHCFFYIEGIFIYLPDSSCTQTLTGTELLKIAGPTFPAVVKLTCYYTVWKSHTSPFSDPASVTVHGELQKPDIDINDESSHDITITCVLPESVRNSSSCNLYTGDQPQAYKEAQAIRMWWKSSLRILCTFSVSKNDLFSRLQERRDVSCDYRENTGFFSLSPHSDLYNFTGQSSTDIVVNSNSPESVPAVQIQQAVVGVASGVGLFLMGLTAVCLCRRTKKINTQRPTARQDDHSQCDLVMGAVSSGGMLDSRDAGIYSLITYAPSTLLPSGHVEENGKSSEKDNSDTYHVYSSIPDRPATSAQPDGLYSLLQTH